jgi:hypothetical protein
MKTDEFACPHLRTTRARRLGQLLEVLSKTVDTRGVIAGRTHCHTTLGDIFRGTNSAIHLSKEEMIDFEKMSEKFNLRFPSENRFFWTTFLRYSVPFSYLAIDMEAILNQIISATVAKFASALSEKTSLPTEEIIEMWKAAVSSVSVQVDGEKATKTRKRQPKKVAKEKTTSDEDKPTTEDEEPTKSDEEPTKSDEVVHACSFKPKKGNSVCGKEVVEGSSMCAAHKRYEGAIAAELAEKKTCGAVISKGDRKGQVCGANVKEGNECCSKHIKKAVAETEKKTCGCIIGSGKRKGETCGGIVKEGNECCSKHTKKEKPSVVVEEAHDLGEVEEVWRDADVADTDLDD